MEKASQKHQLSVLGNQKYYKVIIGLYSGISSCTLPPPLHLLHVVLDSSVLHWTEIAGQEHRVPPRLHFLCFHALVLSCSSLREFSSCNKTLSANHWCCLCRSKTTLALATSYHRLFQRLAYSPPHTADSHKAQGTIIKDWNHADAVHCRKLWRGSKWVPEKYILVR